ncbi:MAG: SufD family Fe-S cluster assembly protein [Opitutales bacterium]|nr:SufD family Fe-S cluster assembly protein [Opitutales bacterium]
MKNYNGSLESLALETADISLQAAKDAFLRAPLPSEKNEHWRFSDVKFWAEAASKLNPDFSAFNLEGAAKIPQNKYARAAFFALVSGGRFDAYLASKICEANIVGVGRGEHLDFEGGLPENVNIFILGENSSMRFKREKRFEKGFFCGANFFFLGKNSSLESAEIFDCAGGAPRYSRADFHLSDGARLNDVFVERGSSNTRSERNVFISGERAEAELAALLTSGAEITHDLRTSQINLAPNSKTNLLVKNLLSGNAKSAFAGLIRVNESAKNTKSYQSCRSLLMSESAKAMAAPILEILTNDVECSHGCTVARPDKEQIFYMKSRGLDAHKANELLAEGFAGDILSRIK